MKKPWEKKSMQRRKQKESMRDNTVKDTESNVIYISFYVTESSKEFED